MLLPVEAVYKLHSLLLQIAPNDTIHGITTPEAASLIFSGPKFLVALLAGVLMAFAFQLLLTNLSVAARISSWGNSSFTNDESESLGSSVRKQETKIGAWALFTSAIALFLACFLAVKLSLVESALIGGIIGVVIWSAYFSILTCLGSSALGSLVGNIASLVSSGLQEIMNTATTAMGANIARKQAVSSAEEITAAVRRELTSGFDVDAVKNTLQNSLGSLQLPTLNFQEIRHQFDQLLQDADLSPIADNNLLKNINRQTFVDLISSRGDLSPKDINQIADQLEAAWKQAINPNNPTEQIINLLKTATPEDLKSEQISDRLQKIISGSGNGQTNGNKSNGVIQRAVQYGLNTAGTALLERLDLEELDVDKITNQLQELRGNIQDLDVEKITQQIKQLTASVPQQVRKQDLPSGSQADESSENQGFNSIKADIEDFILDSFPWHFNRITLKDEFKEVIYDPYANPETIKRELAEIDREFFVNLLQQRNDLSETKIKEIADLVETSRIEVLEMLEQTEAQNQNKSESLRNQIENYLRSSEKGELNQEQIERKLDELLEDPDIGWEDLDREFSGLNRDSLQQILQQRGDMSEEETNNLGSQLENLRDRILNRSQELQQQATAKASELRQKVEDYLRNTNKEELNPEAIEREFRVLLQDPQAGINALRKRIEQFDRDTLVKLLSQREDLSEEDVNRIIDQLEQVRDNIVQAPQKVANQAKQQYEQTLNAIAQYLRDTNLEELNPEGIERDLSKLIANPREGVSALQQRLAEVDRETLVKLLTQRGDLTPEQVNQTIDRLQAGITNIINAPADLAKRASQRVASFESNLEEYLLNTNKDELNPEGIKRDLQLLLQHPRGGIESLSDRLSKFDRSTLVALLSQREDISEEEANQIVDRIESVRNAIAEQYQQLQQRVQSALDGIFARIRTYLNSLNVSELNYEGIQEDFAKLFDDPQAGFEALRTRLGQFDRDTLVAILASREDITPEQANQIISRIETARDRVLQRAEYIQQEVQNRLKEIQRQAQKQAEETKKVIAGAAWWLFSTALTSLAASALAGVIAVRGLNLLG